MSGEKPIVTRTLALLGAFFFAPTLFAFWGFRLAGTVCHHAGAIEHKSQVGSRIGIRRSRHDPPAPLELPVERDPTLR